MSYSDRLTRCPEARRRSTFPGRVFAAGAPVLSTLLSAWSMFLVSLYSFFWV